MKTIYWIGGDVIGNGYVGCTGMTLKDRWGCHAHKAPRRCMVALAHVPDDDMTTESWWIEAMDTLHPNGMNRTPSGRSGSSEGNKQWMLDNPGKAAALIRKRAEALMKWNHNNPEKAAERVRKGGEATKQWMLANPEKAAASQRKGTEAAKQWRLANPEKAAESDRKRAEARWAKKGTGQ